MLAVLDANYSNYEFTPTTLGVRLYGDVKLNDLFKTFIEKGVNIDSVVCNKPSIEDYYLSLIGGVKHD